MQETRDPAKAPENPLSLTGRYQAAWGEHCQRIAQRQSVILWYIGASGALFGYCYTHSIEKSAEATKLNIFLLVSITIITLFSSILMWTHNRVLQELTHFMSECERCAAESIVQHGCPVDLFYFYSHELYRTNRSSGVWKFHSSQRFLQRVVLTSILFIINACTISYVSPTITGPWITGAAWAICLVSIVFSLWGIQMDDGCRRPDIRLDRHEMLADQFDSK